MPRLVPEELTPIGVQQPLRRAATKITFPTVKQFAGGTGNRYPPAIHTPSRPRRGRVPVAAHRTIANKVLPLTMVRVVRTT